MASILSRISGFGTRPVPPPAAPPMDTQPSTQDARLLHDDDDDDDLEDLCMEPEMTHSSYTLGRAKPRSSSANPYTATYDSTPSRPPHFSPIASQSTSSRISPSFGGGSQRAGSTDREEDPERIKSMTSQISTLISLVGGVKKQQSHLLSRIEKLEQIPEEMKGWVEEAISTSGSGVRRNDHQEEMDVLKEVKSLAEMTRVNVERLGAQRHNGHSHSLGDRELVERLEKRVEELERDKKDEAEKRERERLVEQAERAEERLEMEKKLENALMAVQRLSDKVDTMARNQVGSSAMSREANQVDEGGWLDVDNDEVEAATQTLDGPSIREAIPYSNAEDQAASTAGHEGSATIDPRQLGQAAQAFLTEPSGSFNISSLDQIGGDVDMDQFVDDNAAFGDAIEGSGGMVQDEPDMGNDDMFNDANDTPREDEVRAAIAATQGVTEIAVSQTAGPDPQYDTDTSGGIRLVTPSGSGAAGSNASQRSTPENPERTRGRPKRTQTSSTTADVTPVSSAKKKRSRQLTDIDAEFAARRLTRRKPFPTASPASTKKSPARPKSNARLRKSKGEIWRANVKTLLAGDGIPKGQGEWPPKCEYTVEGKANEIICDVCKGRAHYFCAGIADGEAPPEGEWHCPDCAHKIRSGIPKGVIEIADQLRCIRAKCLLRAKVRTVRKPGDENVYYPERIVGRRAISRNQDKSRNFVYLVKWLDWDLEYSTWEPTENFPHQEHMIEDFAQEMIAHGVNSRTKVNLLPEALPYFDADTGDLIDGTDVEADGGDSQAEDDRAVDIAGDVGVEVA